MRFLRQSTQTKILVGPFPDVTLPDVAETELVLSGMDDASLVKHEAVAVVDLVSRTWSHVRGGQFNITLTTSDLDTVGVLRVFFRKESTFLMVWEDFLVLPANTYDALIAGTDTLQTDVIELAGTTQSLTDLKDFADAGYDPATNKVQGVVLTDTATSVTNDVGITQVGADKVWATTVRALTDKAGFALSSAGVLSIWGALTSALTTADSIGKKLADWVLGSDNRSLVSADEHTSGVTVAGVSNLTSGSGSVNTTAESFTLTSGSVVSGSVTDTEQLDDVEHQIDDNAGGTIDVYYQFDVSSTGVPTEVTIDGRVVGSNASLAMYAWNFGGAAWEIIGQFGGQAGPANQQRSYKMLTRHVGTGADLGKSRVRFYGTGLTSPDLYVDRILISYSIINQFIGYANGSVWIDTVHGTAGTVSFYNGYADNPSANLADALVIAGNVGLTILTVSNDSSITLAASLIDFVIHGHGWVLALGGQDITGTHIQGAQISGIGTGTGEIHVAHCTLGDVTLPPCYVHNGPLAGTCIIGSAGTYTFDQCFSQVAGSGTPTLDFSATVGDTAVNFRHYSGGIEIENMGQLGVDTMSLEGHGQLVINANCTGGTISVRGHFKITDNSGGAVTINEDANFTTANVNAEADTALSDYAPATAAALNTHDGKLDIAQADLDAVTGVDGATLATAQANYAPATVAALATHDGKLDSAMGATFNTVTDSLEALRNRGDAAWITGGGAGITQIINLTPFIPLSIDVANTSTVRLGLMLLNSVDDLPSTAEITPGTISIDRKAAGGTAWIPVVTNAAMLEVAGMVYYDEVFNAATGYVAGDSIRATFKSVSITADANTFEIVGATGVSFQTHIRETMRGTDSGATATALNAHDAKLDIVDTNVDTVLADTAELQSSGVKLSAQGKSDVNTEVVDALGVDTLSELAQGQPPATPTLKTAIMFLYMALRNYAPQTGSEVAIYNDAGVKIAKATVSDDNVTFVKEKFVSGA